MKKVAILQSNYIPWKGYFDLIAAVDEFVIYDDVQFTKNDWRNRNRIKTPQGVQWLTIPTGQNINRRIRDVTVDSDWSRKHWKTIESNYRAAPHFNDVASWLRPLYSSVAYSHLSQVNRLFIERICEYLGIHTKITNSWDYKVADGRVERLVDLCVQAEGTVYFSGPAAKAYIDEQAFADRGITVSWFDYCGYTPYPQLWGPFKHEVTILDLLFNCGKDAGRYMRYVRQ